MLQLTLMQSIARYLARFSEEVKLLNDIGDLSINTHAENMLVTLLNEVYGLRLVNVNPTEGRQVAAIDLLDDSSDGGVAFQITSTSSIEKVKDCIRKYYTSGTHLRASRLKVFVITNKQNSYSREAIDKVIREEAACAGAPVLSFSVDQDILDRKDLYAHLYAGNDLEKIKEVEHYLGRQFGQVDEKDRLKAYYSRLKSMFYDTVMDDENGMTLDQVYIEPSFSVIDTSIRKGDPRLKDIKKFYEAGDHYKVHTFIEEMFAGGNPLHLEVRQELVLILGYPGQGKSSFCKKFIHSYILNGNTGKRPLFYFQLRNIRQAKEFIFNPLTILYDEACADTEQTLDKYQFNKSLLVLDGLDELYLRENLKTEDIDKLCVELVRVLEKHPELRIVLTSRYGYIDDAKLAREKINIIQLMSFPTEMQIEWLTRYRRFHPDTWLTEQRLKEFNENKKYTHIRELTGQPLLLHMMASVHNAIDENTNRSAIYQQLFSELIDRKYAKEGQLEVFKGVSKEDLRCLIREVAFAIFKSGNEYITRTDLLKLEASLSFLKLLPEENFRDSIKGVMISFYFKETGKSNADPFDEDRSNYAIEFLHKSLREYMTAEKIFFTLKERFLERKMNGRYVIDDARGALLVIKEILGAQKLSNELIEQIKEISKNTTDLNKEELVDRMLLFLPDYFEHDFIVEYRMGVDRQPLEYSVRCFHGLLHFVATLGLAKNYLKTAETKRKFALYLGLMKDVAYLKLSNQDLSGTDISSGFVSCDLENTDLSKCRITKTDFIYCDFKNVNFKNSAIMNVEMFGSDFSDCTFRWVHMQTVNFRCVLARCDFSSAIILDLLDRPKNITDCKFEGAAFDNKSLKYIKEKFPAIRHQSTMLYSMEKGIYPRREKE